jgi:RimJ/RimL family protein N-acetyltransferase
LTRLAGLPDVTRYVGPGTVWTPEHGAQRSADASRHWTEHGFGWRAALELSSGRAVGFIALNFAGHGTPGVGPTEYEIGWWLDPAVWGRGLAFEGARAVRDHAYEALRVPGLTARIQAANTRSIHLADRLGLTLERQTVGSSGEPVSVYRQTRAEWQALGARPAPASPRRRPGAGTVDNAGACRPPPPRRS